MNRHNVRWLTAVVLAALGCALPGAPAAGQSAWRQAEFVLGTYWDPPCNVNAGNLARDAAAFKLAKDAHFTLLTGAQIEPGIDRSYRGMIWALKVARAAGLKYMVTDNRFYPVYEKDFTRSAGEQVARDYKALPADLRSTLYGYALCDEPHFTTDHITRATGWKQYLESADQEKLVYVNLVACYAPSYNWGGFKGGRGDGVLDAQGKADYERYLDVYVDSLKPSVVSFDHYPFFKNGKVRRDYFYNLEVIRRKAGERPFWAYPMTVDHLEYADPTESQLNFMYFCPLAYGAKGLVAFCFWAPSDTKDYRLSLIDQTGKPTSKYPIVSRLNLYVGRLLGPMIMKSRHVGVYHASRFPMEQLFVQDTLRAAPDVPVMTGNRKLLFGLFRDGSTTYLLVVNKDLAKSETATVSLKGTFTSIGIAPRIKGFTAKTALTYTPLVVSNDGGGTRTSFRVPALDGGEGILIRVKGVL
jgi:hypothetical protein